jgi:uncharacterized membrane protein YdjX (TVP38/TMEM64 family)
MFLVILAGAWSLYRGGALNPAGIAQMRARYPVGAVFLFILVYAVSVLASLPSLPLNLAAGFFWGGLAGGVYAASGAILGGWAAFSTSRLLMGQLLAGRSSNKWAAKVAAEFDRAGWKFVAFARINPIIPTGPLNYLLGLTSLSHAGFLGASFFLLPPSIAVAYIGDVLRSFTATQPGVEADMRDLLIVSACVTLLVFARFAAKIFAKPL